jgi:hypothetical protein
MSTLTFSPQRLGLLIRHDLASQRKSLTTGFLVIAGVAFGIFVLASATGGTSAVLANVFVNVLLIGGYVTSSMAFSELHDSKTGTHYVMLPGSTLEKYTAKLLITSVGWTVAVIVVFAIGTVLGYLVSLVFFAENPGVYLPASRGVWISIGTYLVTQSIFLFGSIYFRKVAFLRTALSVIVVAISLGIIYLIAIRIFFAPAFTGVFETVRGVEQMITGPNGASISEFAAQSILPVFETLQKVLLWVVTPVFFWVVGVMRLRETEV